LRSRRSKTGVWPLFDSDLRRKILHFENRRGSEALRQVQTCDKVARALRRYGLSPGPRQTPAFRADCPCHKFRGLIVDLASKLRVLAFTRLPVEYTSLLYSFLRQILFPCSLYSPVTSTARHHLITHQLHHSYGRSRYVRPASPLRPPSHFANQLVALSTC